MIASDLASQLDLSVIRGDDTTFDIVVQDASGQSVNLQGGLLRFTARLKSDDDLTVITKASNVVGQITFTDAIHGQASLKLTHTDTQALYAPSTLVYDFEFTAASGDVTTVLPAGVLYVLRDVTHT
jgi:hypothetical protein